MGEELTIGKFEITSKDIKNFLNKADITSNKLLSELDLTKDKKISEDDFVELVDLIENSKETYYETLKQSSIGWHTNENDYEPFVKYYLGIIISAYKEFETRVHYVSKEKLSKPERIAKVIEQHIGKITKTEIMKLCPDISQTTIQRTLNNLLESNTIVKIGGGRYTSYIWNWEEKKK